MNCNRTHLPQTWRYFTTSNWTKRKFREKTHTKFIASLTINTNDSIHGFLIHIRENKTNGILDWFTSNTKKLDNIYKQAHSFINQLYTWIAAGPIYIKHEDISQHPTKQKRNLRKKNWTKFIVSLAINIDDCIHGFLIHIREKKINGILDWEGI